MNKLLIFIGLILVFFVAACGHHSAEDNVLFESSNKKFADEKYADALAGYQKIELAGNKTPALYTNMGALYYKTHQYGRSILYFEKGLMIAPLDTDLIYNRDKVLRKLTNAVDTNDSAYNTNRESFFKTLDVLNIIAIIEVMISAMVYLFFLLKPAEQSKFYNAKTLRIALAISVGILILISLSVKIYQSTKYVIVVAPNATVYLGPSALSKVVSDINEGYKLEVTNKFDGWFEIKDFQGKTGWVSADKLGEIE